MSNGQAKLHAAAQKLPVDVSELRRRARAVVEAIKSMGGRYDYAANINGTGIEAFTFNDGGGSQGQILIHPRGVVLVYAWDREEAMYFPNPKPGLALTTAPTDFAQVLDRKTTPATTAIYIKEPGEEWVLNLQYKAHLANIPSDGGLTYVFGYMLHDFTQDSFLASLDEWFRERPNDRQKAIDAYNLYYLGQESASAGNQAIQQHIENPITQIKQDGRRMPLGTKIRGWISAALIIGTLVVTSVFLAPGEAADRNTLENGLTAVGTPTGEYHERVIARRYGTRIEYRIEYSFEAEGRTYRVRGERGYGTEQKVKTAIDQILKDGVSVEVRYDADNPYQSVVVIDTEPPSS